MNSNMRSTQKHYIKIAKTNNKENFKSVKGKGRWISYLSVERKKLLTKNSLSGKTIFQLDCNVWHARQCLRVSFLSHMTQS